MVIDDFDIEGVAVMPFKADSPLFVDTDYVLSFPFASESMKHVSRIQHQGVQAGGGLEDHQTLSRLPLK
jgi:hypothetical protein